MVAPLIVGAAKVTMKAKKVAKVARTASKAKKAMVTASKIESQVNRARNVQKLTKNGKSVASAAADLQNELPTALQKNGGLVGKIPMPSIKAIDTVASTVKAASTATVIFWTAIAFYPIQLAMWLVGLAGIGIDTIPGISDLHVGIGLYSLAWMVILFIGFASMIYAAIMFTINGVSSFKGWRGIIFIGCMAGYGVVLANIVPWFALWVGSVVLTEGAKLKNKEWEGEI